VDLRNDECGAAHEGRQHTYLDSVDSEAGVTLLTGITSLDVLKAPESALSPGHPHRAALDVDIITFWLF
jgi:hypothetical protein